MDDNFDFECIAIDEAEIEARLETLRIPYAEEYFASTQSPPYAVYLTPSAVYYGADGVNLKRDQNFRIELVTKSKKDKVRRKFLNLFDDTPFEVEEESGGQRNYYLTAISFTSTLDLEDDEDEDIEDNEE
jgi:hypothetical protein